MGLELEPESVDRAAELLARYDPGSGSWDIQRTGSFWESCELLAAHPPVLEGDSGEGPLVAVVDGAFDVSIPALRRHEQVAESEVGEDATHGTIVALLILEVAPDARLLLYPVARNGKLDPELTASSVRDAGRRGAKVLNLSMGVKRPLDDWFDRDRFAASLGPEEHGHEFAELQALADADFRAWLRVPATPVGLAAEEVTRGTTQVVAAAGNMKGRLSTPAVLPGVLSAGFISEVRTVVDGLETAVGEQPSFAQSAFTDVAVVQPPHVLGSSFATPLISGFVASACSREELAGFRETARLGGLAARMWLLTRGKDAEWNTGRDGVVDDLYLRSIGVSPHQHQREVGAIEPCPACSFFAAPTFINFGVFKLNWNDLTGAEVLLRTVRAFAPNNPFAAANLGVTYSVMADRHPRSEAGVDPMRALLGQAIEHLRAAVRMRPDYQDYRDVLVSLEAAERDPMSWPRLRA